MDDGARIPLVALQTAVRADVDAREHNDIARKREAARLYVAAIAALEAGEEVNASTITESAGDDAPATDEDAAEEEDLVSS